MSFYLFVDLAVFGPYSMLFMNTLNVYAPLHWKTKVHTHIKRVEV